MFTIFLINVVNHAAHYFEILNLHYEYIYFLLITPQSVTVYNMNIAYTTHSVIYIWNLWFKKQQPVMRLFYNVPIKITLKINYLDFFCFSKLPMIKITFNINYLDFFCFPKLLRVAFNYLHILLLWLTYWHAEAAFY